MAAQKGSLVLLKIGNGAPTGEVFTTVGGLRTTGFIHNNQSVDATHSESGAWRALLDGAGTRSVSISGAGVFTDSSAERTLRQLAMDNSIRNYKLTFGNGDTLTGAFQITSYQRIGNFNEAESYTLTLASAGAVAYTRGGA